MAARSGNGGYGDHPARPRPPRPAPGSPHTPPRPSDRAETRPDPACGRAARVVAAAAAELTRKSHLRNRAGRRVYQRFRRDTAVALPDPPSSAAFKRARSARMTRHVPPSPFRRGAWRVSDIFTCNLLCYWEILAVIAILHIQLKIRDLDPFGLWWEMGLVLWRVS